MGRATQGVTLIALDEGMSLSGLQRVAESDSDTVVGQEAGPELGAAAGPGGPAGEG
jgi:DNA gyrase subunit A